MDRCRCRVDRGSVAPMIDEQRAPDGSRAIFGGVDVVGCRVMRYRYFLERPIGGLFGRVGSTITWVMLNPSTADAFRDDPTVARISKRSRSLGHARLIVVNVFGLRSTSPRELRFAGDPVGPHNDEYIELGLSLADEVVGAWGGSFPAAFAGRVSDVRAMLASHAPMCLGRTKSGQPRHPLYVSMRQGLEAL